MAMPTNPGHKKQSQIPQISSHYQIKKADLFH